MYGTVEILARQTSYESPAHLCDVRLSGRSNAVMLVTSRLLGLTERVGDMSTLT